MCGDEAAAARSMLQITYPVCDTSRTLYAILIAVDGKWYHQEMGRYAAFMELHVLREVKN